MYRSDLDCDFMYSTVGYFVWSVAVDYCILYLHFSLNSGSSIMYELQSVLTIGHKCAIVNIKNDAGGNLKYA